MDMVIRALSLALVALFAYQLANRKGSPRHVAAGIAAGACAALVLGAVLYRGYVQYDEPHGALYPVHLALTGLFLPSFGTAVWSGIALRRNATGWRHLPRVHGIAALSAAVLLVALLAAGVLSRLSPR